MESLIEYNVRVAKTLCEIVTRENSQIICSINQNQMGNLSITFADSMDFAQMAKGLRLLANEIEKKPKSSIIIT
jgi:hypothetical protein